MMQDSLNKRAAITKLGQEVIVWNKTRGVVLSEKATDHFLVSLSDSGISWSDVVHIVLIEVYTGQKYQISTKNEVVELEDESCGSGGCKI
jgi:hypothetical protein